MSLSCIIAAACLAMSPASGATDDAQTVWNRRVSIDVVNSGRIEAIKQVMAAAHVPLRMDRRVPALAALMPTITLRKVDAKLSEVMEELLAWVPPGPHLGSGLDHGEVWIAPRIDLPSTRVSLEAVDMDIGDALAALLRQVRLNYVYIVDNRRPNRVTVHLHHVPFEVALIRLLRAAEPGCAFEYWKSENIPDVPNGQYRPWQHILVMDPIPSGGQSESPPTDMFRFTVEVHRAPLVWLIKALMKTARVNYTLGVSGLVDLSVKSVAIEDALGAMIKARKLAGHPMHYRIEDGVYIYADGVPWTADPPTKALFAATQAGDAAGVAAALEQGASVRAKDRSGSTALHTAAGSVRLDIAQRLVEAGADVGQRDDWGRTPIIRAALNADGRSDWIGTFEYLLDKGADVNARDHAGMTALLFGIAEQYEPLVGFLLNHGANPNMGDLDGSTAMHRSAGFNYHEGSGGHSEEESYSRILALLLGHGGRIEVRDAQGRTPLMEAAWQQRGRIVRFLITRGAKINATDKLGRTALTFAAPAGRDNEIVRFLLANGARMRFIDRVLMGEPETGLPFAQTVLDERGPYGETLLMLSAEKDDVNLVRQLLALGADVNATDSQRLTALMLAIGGRPLNWIPSGSHEWAKKGANPARVEVVRLLLAAGARTDLKNQHKETALDAARAVGDSSILALLPGAAPPTKLPTGPIRPR